MREIKKIFIVHYSKLSERKTHMLKEADKWFANTDYEFELSHDQEVLTDEIIERNFDLKAFKNRFERDMSRGEMSLCMKYKAILSQITEEKDGELFLILEDDVIFKESPLDYVKRVEETGTVDQLKYDCLFMGEALIRKGDDRDVFYEKQYPSTNGLCTVLYTRSVVEKMDDHLKNNRISQPLDWEFNDLFRDLGLKVYWGKAITVHGSVSATSNKDFNFFKSSLRESY
jgi:GR25 family glycosyltransferase involved in LPS biosynthesis